MSDKNILKTIQDKLNKVLGISNFVSAETEAGTIMWEGDLAEGTMVTIEVDGEPQPAPEGAHMITDGDMAGMTITLDADGMVTGIAEAEMEEEENETLTPEEVMAALAALMQKNSELEKEISTKDKSHSEKIKSLTERLEKIEKFAEGSEYKPEKKKFKKPETKPQDKKETNSNPFGLEHINQIYYKKVKQN